MSFITLTTDFGTRDWFVGTMKGVIARLASRTGVVDLTHEISPGDIRAGAFALAAGYLFFPRNTIHVAVVDPGVGTKRRAIAVRTSNYTFVGPDNGVLSWALAAEKVQAIHLLDNHQYFLPQVSFTFHGRDVFAPVAAQLSKGLSLRKLGPRLTDFIRLEQSRPKKSIHSVQGEVLYIDRFGNAITNITSSHLDSLNGVPAIFVGGKRVCNMARAYQDVARGRAVAVVGSSDFLEIAVNGGNAAEVLKLRVGVSVEARSRRGA